MTLLYLSQLPVPLSSLRWPQAKAHGSLLYLQTQQRDTMNYSCYDNSRTNTIVWKTNSILPIPCKQLKCSSQRLGNSAVGSVRAEDPCSGSKHSVNRRAVTVWCCCNPRAQGCGKEDSGGSLPGESNQEVENDRKRTQAFSHMDTSVCTYIHTPPHLHMYTPLFTRKGPVTKSACTPTYYSSQRLQDSAS